VAAYLSSHWCWCACVWCSVQSETDSLTLHSALDKYSATRPNRFI